MMVIKDGKKYFPVPPIKNKLVEYQNVNNDEELRLSVINFFYNEIKSLLNNNSKFEKYKLLFDDMKSNNKKKFVYSSINHIVKKYKINWYELRTIYYDEIISYIHKKLKHL